MVTDKRMIEERFGWGEGVRVVDTAPQKYQGMETGSVCGMRSIETEDVAEEFGEPTGSMLYLMEDPNGYAIEIPGRFLEPI